MRLDRLMISAFLLAALPALAAPQPTPAGRWLTQNKEAVIDIEPCGAGLCGRIVGVTLDHPDDPLPTDGQGRSQCGLTIIRNVAPDGDMSWSARITDPRDGKIYQARLRLDERHRLRVRGFIGIPLLGRTEVWTPFHAEIGENCRMPAS